MKCDKCAEEFDESFMEESHDVPCYIFKGMNRRVKKNKADKFGRHWLCKDCHVKYEEGVRMSMKVAAVEFAKKQFGEDTIWKE